MTSVHSGSARSVWFFLGVFGLTGLGGCSSSATAPDWALPENEAPSLLDDALSAKSDAQATSEAGAGRPGDAGRNAGERDAKQSAQNSAQGAPPAPGLSVLGDAGDARKSGGSEEDSAAAQESTDAVAWIAGSPLMASDLLSEWYWIAGRDLWLVFDKLVAMRLAALEAQRLGVRMAPESVEYRVAEENRRLAKEVATLGPDVTIEDYLKTRHGFQPEGYFRHLRVATIRQMMAERSVRSWTLGNEWARVRLIVVSTGEDLAKVQAGLADGREFAELARELSLDDTSQSGGLVPYLVRQEHSPLARLAFATPVGETAGPLEVSGHHAMIQVESRHAPQSGMWSDIGTAVEASLRENPLTDSEFLHWKLNMEKRYSVDAGPLEALLGG